MTTKYAIIESYSAIASNRTYHQGYAAEGHWHVGHCFDYLRQSIMCCGDVALEGAETTFPEGEGGSDGWDAKHVCKDYRQVFEYLEEKRATNDSWI